MPVFFCAVEVQAFFDLEDAGEQEEEKKDSDSERALDSVSESGDEEMEKEIEQEVKKRLDKEEKTAACLVEGMFVSVLR